MGAVTHTVSGVQCGSDAHEHSLAAITHSAHRSLDRLSVAVTCDGPRQTDRRLRCDYREIAWPVSGGDSTHRCVSLTNSQVLTIISSDSLLLIQSKGKTDPLQEAASSIESIVSKFKTKVGRSV